MDLNELDAPCGRRLVAWLRGPREVVNDTANVLVDRDMCRHQFGLRKVSDAIFVDEVVSSRTCGRDVARWTTSADGTTFATTCLCNEQYSVHHFLFLVIYQ